MAMMNLATLHRTAPTRFLPPEHHGMKTDLIQGIDIPTPKGTNHTPPIMLLDMGVILAGHSHTTIPTVTEAALHCSTSCCPSANRCPHHHLCSETNWHSHTLFCTQLSSYRHHSYHSTDQTQSCYSNSHHIAQETQPRKAEPCPRSSTCYKSYHSKTVTIQNSPSDSSSDSDSD